jgi:hypothetical protein
MADDDRWTAEVERDLKQLVAKHPEWVEWIDRLGEHLAGIDGKDDNAA